MREDIYNLLESIDENVRDYSVEYGLPLIINDKITEENMIESVKRYSRKLLWRLAHGYEDSDIANICDYCTIFIREEELMSIK